MQSDGGDRAATMAYRVLVRLGVQALPVDPLAILLRCSNTRVWTDAAAADHLGISPAELHSCMGDADALTFLDVHGGRERYLIVYRKDENPARLRFTLAHELGHRLLHHGQPNERQEAEADCFASHLLCPRPAMVLLAARTPHFTASQAAVLAYVSLSAAKCLGSREDRCVDAALLHQVEEQLRPWCEQTPMPQEDAMQPALRIGTRFR